jgi:small GTP-binding protein
MGKEMLRCAQHDRTGFSCEIHQIKREELYMPTKSAKTPEPEKKASEKIPRGFTLRHVLRGHKKEVNRIAWSPDGRILASPSDDFTIKLWDLQTGQLLRTFVGHTGDVRGVAWSPDGRVLASGGADKTIRLWDVQTGKPLQTLSGHTNDIQSVAWSPDGRVLASGGADKTIRLWDAQTGEPLRKLTGHTNYLTRIEWSPDGQNLASGSYDHTVRLWDTRTGKLLHTLTGHSDPVLDVKWSPDGKVFVSSSHDRTIRLWNPNQWHLIAVLEAHTDLVTCVSFSYDGHLLASRSEDGTVRIWRTDIWDTVAILEEEATGAWPRGLAFHPHAPILATLGENETVIRIWDLDFTALLGTTPAIPSVQYTNAKVVLVGDSGVGKSGLGLVLNGQKFVPTESTHGRHVWTFDSGEVALDSRRREMRETLLWDLAGQPGYRLIHQLHLNEVAVALVVFDARSETDPFTGVDHWDRALRQAQRVQGSAALPLKKFLVAARVDRVGKAVSRARIKSLIRALGFDGYFETSAKEGRNITDLAEAIKNAIDWTTLPKVSSSELFQQIKEFLIAEKEAGHLLSTADDLYRTFLRSQNAPPETAELRAQFETCIGRVESRDLIRRLSFGNLVLLQPELLDSYASALVNAVKDEPDGLGSIAEEKARAGKFDVPRDERLKDKEQEKLLLIAMVEDLLGHEIVLREYAEDGPYLVFPSQSTRENPDLPDPEGKSVIFDFEGPVQNVYATLAVRLSHSGMFKKTETWRDAVTYTTRAGGKCGIWLRNIGEGRGELTLFFDKTTGEETRFYFEDYVHTHLERRAIPESVQRRRIFVCSDCGFIVTAQLVMLRSDRGFDWLDCPVCSTRISLFDRTEQLSEKRLSVVQAMDRAADAQRERETAASIIQGKIATGDFDVFLCHKSADKAEVKKIGEKLKERGILPWLDEWELRPGIPWQRLLEHQIGQIKSAAVFVGKSEVERWQQEELESLLSEFVHRACPVIPVLLPGAPKEPKVPLFLRNRTWVDFRRQDPDPMEQLIWGVTGKRERL